MFFYTYPLSTIATASFNTLSPNTKAYKFTSTCKSLKIEIIVSGSVGDINAPKYKVSKNVNEAERCGINCTKAYIKALKRKQIMYMSEKCVIKKKLFYKEFLLLSIVYRRNNRYSI